MIKFSEYHNLQEGGAFGHLSNVFDINYTKAKLIEIINDSIELKFTLPEIKTDAINLMVSVRNGKVIAARNKSHLKNYGENAMGIKEIAEKFAGREIGEDYRQAMVDLQNAIQSLSVKQQEKVFNNGKNWMSIEVMSSTAKNIIDYQGIVELRLHGTIEHNEQGEKISQINKEAARMFDGMLRQRKAERQSKFTIRKLTRAEFNPIKNSNKYKKELVTKIKNILGSNKDIDSYKINELTKIISKKTSDKQLTSKLIDRWVRGVKTPTITAIYKEYPNDKAWIQSMDKEIGYIMKNIMLPIEEVFLKLGGLVMGSAKVFMSLNPEETKKDLHKKLQDAIQLINTKGDEKAKAKLKLELRRFEAAGGVNSISADEGVTFFVGDDFLKLTGSFAPLNQILGMLYSL